MCPSIPPRPPQPVPPHLSLSVSSWTRSPRAFPSAAAAFLCSTTQGLLSHHSKAVPSWMHPPAAQLRNAACRSRATAQDILYTGEMDTIISAFLFYLLSKKLRAASSQIPRARCSSLGPREHPPGQGTALTPSCHQCSSANTQLQTGCALGAAGIAPEWKGAVRLFGMEKMLQSSNHQDLSRVALTLVREQSGELRGCQKP